MIAAIDHVNLRTTQLEEMTAWYQRVLLLKDGPRPPFGFPGAWLYAGDHAVVHLVGVSQTPPQVAALAMEHVAFRASGLPALLDRLRAEGQTPRLARVPEMPILQVNVIDPDGNHLHVDFHIDEAEGIDIDAA